MTHNGGRMEQTSQVYSLAKIIMFISSYTHITVSISSLLQLQVGLQSGTQVSEREIFLSLPAVIHATNINPPNLRDDFLNLFDKRALSSVLCQI